MNVKAEDYGLEPVKAMELTSGLSVVKQERELLINEFNEVSKLEVCKENIPVFKELRLRIVKNRTQGINKWHKSNKEFFLTGGKFVDAIKNKEIDINNQMEEKLMSAEKHFENLEKERLSELQKERVGLLSEYVEDASERDLSSMEEDVWVSYLSTKKQNYLDKVQAELNAEKERQAKIKAEKEEQERVRKENAKLKAEAEAKEELRRKRSKELQPYLVFIRDYNDLILKNETQYRKEFLEIKKGAEDHWEFERKEQIRKQKEEEERKAKEEKERKIREEQERKERAEYEAKLKSEREAKQKIEREEKAKREKLQAELKAKEEELIKAKKEEEAKKQAELSKGDEEKINDLIADLELLKTKFSFKSDKNKKMYIGFSSLVDKTITFIKK